MSPATFDLMLLAGAIGLVVGWSSAWICWSIYAERRAKDVEKTGRTH